MELGMIKLFWNLFVLHLLTLNMKCFLSSLTGMFRYGKRYYNVDRTPHALGLGKNPCFIRV